MAACTAPGVLNFHSSALAICIVREEVVQINTEEDCETTVFPLITIMGLRLDFVNYHLPKGLVQRFGNFVNLNKICLHFCNVNSGFE